MTTNLATSFGNRANALTAVLLIRGPIVVAIVYSVADVFPCDAATVTAGELSVGVAGAEQAARLVAVIPAVIIVIAAVVIWHTTAISTCEHSGLAGVKCCHAQNAQKKRLILTFEVRAE